jgi:hypothetical protein
VERHGVIDRRIKGPPAGVAQGLGVRGRDGCEKTAHDEDNAELGHDFYDFIGLSDTGVIRPFPCHELGLMNIRPGSLPDWTGISAVFAYFNPGLILLPGQSTESR